MSDQIRNDLRNWVVQTNGKINPADLSNDTNIIQERIITSLQIMDLILFIERLSGKPVDPAKLKPGSMRSVDDIVKNFFCEDSYAH